MIGLKSNFARNMIFVLGLVMVFYHMFATQHVIFNTFQHQSIHLGLILPLLFFDRARRSLNTPTYYLYILMGVAGIIVNMYVFLNIDYLEESFGFPESFDVIIGVVLILLVVEATRIAWGWTLPIVTAVFLIYFFFGHHLTGPLYHRNFSFEYIISYLSIGLSGIYGTFLGISANQVFLFVIFGALLGVIKVNDFFFEAGKVAGKAFQGGPGQTAVVSSALVGTVSGAAVANVAITGAFTIPFMKRVGYKPELAGAIESTASTGGQIMPPVMGAAAFLMAAFLGVPYADVMLAGVIPAILFFFCVMLGVQFIAVRDNIRPPKEKIDFRILFQRFPLFTIPLGVLIVLLLKQYSPALAAFWAIILSVGLACLSKETRPSITELLKNLVGGAVIGAQIGISLAIVGMIAQTLITTGLGSKIAGVVEIISNGNLVYALVLAMIVSIILGCGVPTSAAYTLVAIVVVPIIIDMGVEPISAHFFALYFAVMSALTPPVALAALAGAGIAKANYFKTSLSAFKLAVSGFIIPFIIIYNPVFLMQPINSSYEMIYAMAGFLSLITLTSTLYGCALTKYSSVERGLSALLTVFLLIIAFSPSGLSSNYIILAFIGFFVSGSILLFFQIRKFRLGKTAGLLSNV